LEDEYRLRLCENSVLKKITGPKKDKVTRNCRKLYNEELHGLYYSPNTIWVTKPGKLVAHMAEKKYTPRFTAAHPGVRRPLARFRSRWEDNIRIGIKRMEGRGMD
jgi:hypothetical protein